MFTRREAGHRKLARRAFITRSAAAGLGLVAGRMLPGLAHADESSCAPAPASGRIVELRTLEQVRAAGRSLRMTAIKGVDLSEFDAGYWRDAEIGDSYFLGCRCRGREAEAILREKGASILPPFAGLPYDPYRTTLYTFEELERPGSSGVTLDQEIYCDYLSRGRFSPDVIEALARRIHDDSIDDALERFVAKRGKPRFVGIMGSRRTRRDDPWYRRTAETAYLIAKEGRVVTSGGGQGMMEAANLGAYLSSRDRSALDAALAILASAPSGDDARYRGAAMEVKNRFPGGAESLAVSTWFYGTESINPFATRIARYFDRCIRESQLIATSRGGIIFSPGGAGTREEIFLTAEESHYPSPADLNLMVFLGKRQYEVSAPVYPLLRELADRKDVLFITDEPAAAARYILKRLAR